MKGYTKGKGKGKKFIPTSKKKSALSSNDIRHEDSIPFGAISQFATDKAINKGIDIGNSLGAISKEDVKNKGKEKGKSALSFIVKATGDSLKKAKQMQQDKAKRQREIAEDQERIETINETVIDDIIDNRQTTNEQKFRFLQRYAIDNNESLTEKQRLFVNNTLKKLEQEAHTPTTYLGASASSSSSKSSRPIFSTPSKTATPVKMLSGQMVTPSTDDVELNKAKALNPTMNPVGYSSEPVTTTTTTTMPSSPAFANLSDNLNAEIGAVVG